MIVVKTHSSEGAAARVTYKGLLLIAIPLILLLILVGRVVYVQRQSESARVRALHATEVLRVSQSLLTELAATESAFRGYVITHDAAFVDAYKKSLTIVELTIGQLRGLVSGDSQQDARTRTIVQPTEQRTQRLAGLFRLVESGNKAPAEDDIKGETGPELMKQVRAELAVFTQEEERLGAERRHTQDTSWQWLSWLLVAGTAGTILASVLTIWFVGGASGACRRSQSLRRTCRRART